MSNTSYKRLTEADICEILIKSAENKEKLLIIAHRNPDGDAVGSAFALKMIYKALGARAVCACGDKVPDYLRFLLRDQDDMVFDENEEFDRIMTVDTASVQQMGALCFLAPKVSFAIDHHAMGEQYCDACIDGTSAAAGEIVYRIYVELINRGALNADPDVYRLIYAAISADTGSFRYSNTTSKTHSAVASIIEAINEDRNGLSCADISRLIHDSKSLSTLKATKLCIEKMKWTEGAAITYAVISREDIKNAGLGDEDLGSCIDIPRSVAGSLLSFVLKETATVREDGLRTYRISARSSCSVSVAEICKKFGGGGHEKAAGGEIVAENGEIAEKAVLSEFKKAIGEVK
ncbi:MAG: DHH family phosphoesterase [Clostridia bacterium]|nr:DHH family phosphoesterase [Clostridia bacterium]